MKQKEVWKTLEEFPMYQVSNKGRIYSFYKKGFIKGGKILGYKRFSLKNKDYPKGKHFYLGRLVYLMFGENPELLPYRQVDHISRRRSNNNINNLRLLTASENSHNKAKRRGCLYQSIFRGVRYDKSRGKWKCDFHYNGDIKVSLGNYEDQVNAGYVWYHVAKEFRGVMGDNRKLFKSELPEKHENREEKIKEGIARVNQRLNNYLVRKYRKDASNLVSQSF